MKHLFVVNPVAGKGKSLSYISKIHELFKFNDDNYIIEITEEKGHAIDLVRKYVQKDDYRVYAIGGDGTVNEVLNGLVDSNSSLAVIPCGTGNDFARTLIPDYKLHTDILQHTIMGYEKYIDLAKANGRYFINISSVGFDSEVIYNARHFKKSKFIPSGLAYILSLFYTPFIFKALNMDINIDGQEFIQENLLLAASNGKCYGGGIPIAPHANIEDGFLDVCMVSNASLSRLLHVLPKALKGNHISAEEVKFFKGKKITVESENDFILNADGELERINKVEFEIIPHKVKVVVPI